MLLQRNRAALSTGARGSRDRNARAGMSSTAASQPDATCATSSRMVGCALHPSNFNPLLWKTVAAAARGLIATTMSLWQNPPTSDRSTRSTS